MREDERKKRREVSKLLFWDKHTHKTFVNYHQPCNFRKKQAKCFAFYAADLVGWTIWNIQSDTITVRRISSFVVYVYVTP